jgi:hypothetical protein
LPSVTLGKAFAECKIAFAVCLEHTAKKLILVVRAGGLGFWVPSIKHGPNHTKLYQRLLNII